MKKNVIIIICILLVFSAFLLTGCNRDFTDQKYYERLISEKTQNNEFCASYIYDTSNLNEVVGYADYVFVAQVVNYLDTTHDSPSGIPYTVYSVSVIENIKGSLVTDTEIIIYKSGGMEKNGIRKEIGNGDNIVKKNLLYVFSAIATEEGELHLSGPNSSVEIIKTANIKEDTEYSRFISAYEDQIISEYKQNSYTSIYDVSVYGTSKN